MDKLTAQERKLAEENASLIYKYLSDNELPEDEYYGICSIGFLKGIKAYLKRPDLQQYSLSTVVFQQMRSEVSHYRKYLNEKCRREEQYAISLDEPIDTEEERSNLHDLVGDSKVNVPSDVISTDLYKNLMLSLNKRDKEIVKLLLTGYTQTEIANHYQLSRQMIGLCVERIRKKTAEIYGVPYEKLKVRRR